jgi:hypothetical protein
MKAVTTNYKGEFKTAREMALTSHNLSRDGMSCRTADGRVWKWSNRFQVWTPAK